MPELKRVPQSGRMNRDFHERILPPGEYREALNVNIGRSETSEVGTVENLLGNELMGQLDFTPATGKTATCIGSYRDNGGERIYYFVTDNDEFDESNPSSANHRIYEYSQRPQILRTLVSSNELNFHKDFPVTGINLVDELLLWTDNRNEPRKINIDRARQEPNFYSSDNLMAVAKLAPYESATITNVSEFDGDGNAIDSNFLQDKLPRFSYRWRFNDGEYSLIAPFTPIIFSRLGNSEDLTGITNAGEIASFVNAVKFIQFQVPTPEGFGITSVELIYKETTSSTLYIVEDKPVTSENSINFEYTSQDPFRTIPPSQLTRVSDAVPRRALSQEVAGARVVYGNYLQNFNLPNVDFTVSTQNTQQESNLENFSVKSRRTYQVGIVLSDIFGRTTPVILSNSGGDSIFVNPQVGENAFQGLTITFDDVSQLEGFYSYKVVIKQREQEYYNWISEATVQGIRRIGDNINKIPRDTTAQDPGNPFISPVDVSVYPKVFGSTNETGDLVKVQQINNFTTDSLRQFDGTAVVPGAPTSGLVVYETEPVNSLLNIFFETSTGGLISRLASDTPINISFYNCYILSVGGYHIEANRLRLGFNEPFFDIGVKAHVVNEEYSGEERRSNTLIHSSGFFNSRTGLNQLNQFNEAEGGITLSLDPSDGSIQKLYAEDTQLIIWQEDKVSRSPIDKDFIYSAEGGAVPVTSNTQYLGTVAPYAGEYGISRDPQSFAVYGTRKYFTDRNRGVVIRLSNDGLTEISQAGMSDFFRDALRTADNIIGSFDEYHNTYNLTIIGDAYDRNEDTNAATAADGYFTVGFEEDTNGWVSFKSFQQESGLTLNNMYYTFSGGQLWLHNSSRVMRNSFYGNPISESYVDFIFNDSPSVVKDFFTLGYEGESGWRCDYIQTDIDSAGDVPVVNNNYVDVTLNVSSSASNTIFRGERISRVLSGQTVRFVIVVEPISLQYVIDDLNDINLTVDGANVTKRLNDGRMYFLIEQAVTENTMLSAEITGGSGLAFNITLLTINLLEQVTNATLRGSVSRAFDNQGPTSFTYRLIADNGYYLNMGDISHAADQALLDIGLDPSTVVITIDESDPNDLSVTIPVDVPSTVTSGNLTITGNARMTPILTWEPGGVGVFSRAAGDLTVPIPPRANDSLRTESITVTAPANMVFVDDLDINITNGLIASRTIGENGGTATATVRSIISTEDLTTGLTVVDNSVMASLGGPYNELSFISTSATFQEIVVNSNIDFTISADMDWVILSAEGGSPGDTISIRPMDNTIGTERTATITISNNNPRTDIVIPDVTFLIRQDG